MSQRSIEKKVENTKKPFDILAKETRIEGPHFLQASAGTGKTFSIEHLFVRLLLAKRDLNIENILVVTFTRAAVLDLQKRIRSNIEKTLFLLRKGSFGQIDYLSPYTSLEARSDAIYRLEESLHLLEKIQIYTIHSFCYCCSIVFD